MGLASGRVAHCWSEKAGRGVQTLPPTRKLRRDVVWKQNSPGGEKWLWLIDLARLAGDSAGCTRPAVDEGWAPGEAMVGTSGLGVRPDLYPGIGLSGDPHHPAGVLDAGLFINVNSDLKAPVFRYADYGVTAGCGESRPYW